MLRLQHEGSEPERLQWSPADWESFHAESAELSVRAVGVVTLVCALLLLAWVPGDFDYFPEHAVRFTWFRLAAIAWSVAMAIAAAKLKAPSAKYLALWAWFLGWGAQSAAMIPYTPEDLLSHTVVLLIAQLGSLGVLVWSWKWGLAMSLQLVAIGEIGLSRVSDGGYDIFAAHGYLLTGAAFCTLFTAVKYRGARQQFDQRLRLEEEKQRSEGLLSRVTDLRVERLTWLENLAGFLRHELKNQIVAMGTSIELAADGASLEVNRRYLERANRSLNRMRGLVSSATEATTLEAALVVEDTERVDLSALVADRAQALRQQNPSRKIDLDLKPALSIEGNEGRLAQLLDKLLDNALEHSEPDAEIRVALRSSDGDWFEISVENEGDALPEDKDRIFEAFVSTRSRPENLGIGLFVARCIARNHGGLIFAEDLPSTEGARFVLRLPSSRARTDDQATLDSVAERIDPKNELG